MRILIVDDERPARDRLRRLLALAPGVDAIDEAADGIEALARIARFQPDALLLDIDMPELSGIELAASLPDPAPLVVFVTAHDHYATRAFDCDAIDYLLKPCDPVRLQRTLARLRQRLQERAGMQDGRRQGGLPQGCLPQDRLPLRQLVVSERGVARIVPIDDIGWIETADNYVALHTATGSPLLRQTLAGLLERLGPAFARCHRRAAVRLARIDQVVALDKGDGLIVLRGGAQVPCSRQYRADVMAKLQGAPAA
jgi:two-component system LytT family response regulator